MIISVRAQCLKVCSSYEILRKNMILTFPYQLKCKSSFIYLLSAFSKRWINFHRVQQIFMKIRGGGFWPNPKDTKTKPHWFLFSLWKVPFSRLLKYTTQNWLSYRTHCCLKDRVSGMNWYHMSSDFKNYSSAFCLHNSVIVSIKISPLTSRLTGQMFWETVLYYNWSVWIRHKEKCIKVL